MMMRNTSFILKRGIRIPSDVKIWDAETLDARNIGTRAPRRHKNEVWMLNLSVFCRERF